MRPTAPNAPLRPFQIASDCSGVSATFIEIGSKRAQMPRSLARSESCSATLPSTSMISIASASSG